MLLRLIKDWLLILDAAFRAGEDFGPHHTHDNLHPIYGVWYSAIDQNDLPRRSDGKRRARRNVRVARVRKDNP